MQSENRPAHRGDEREQYLRHALEMKLNEKVALRFSPEDLDRHALDYGSQRALTRALGVAYPADVDQVRATVLACATLAIPIVTQGGLTGMAGGAIPTPGCLILSLERLRGIEEIDVEAATMTVLAGTPLQSVQEAAVGAGMMFALDLGSRGSCTIGGNVATNAGGNRVLRFGMMRDIVLGVEVVLADGTIVTSLNKMLKNNAGYDLKNLFIGSEGTLGIVTRVVLRLHPQPRSACTAICAVPDFRRLLSLLKLARATLGPQLSAFEAMWQEFYSVAVANTPCAPLDPTSGTIFVLLDMLGSNPELDPELFEKFLEAALHDGSILDATIAQSTAESRRFWAIRDASGELPRLWGKCVNFDISIPIGSMEQFLAACRERLSRVAAHDEVLIFGHIADSNLHIACRDLSGTRKPIIEAAVYETVREWHGSVSAEHGIGLDKKLYLSFSRSENELELMRRIKRALDPKELLNPGKVLSLSDASYSLE